MTCGKNIQQLLLSAQFILQTKKKPKEVHDIGHIHWDAIWPIIKQNPGTFFVLIHSSLSIGRQET